MTSIAEVPSECARPIDALGDAIGELAARLHAATYELLVLLHEFDERCGWNTGFLSCAHWLSWRTGIAPGAAREKVRVARALADLPRVSAAMKRGELSYAKVRAITRVARPETETRLLDVALAGTAAHVERIVRAWRRVDRIDAARRVDERHLQRQVTTWVDDDGMLVIRGRLTPELGAVVQRALDAASDRLFHESARSSTGGRRRRFVKQPIARRVERPQHHTAQLRRQPPPDDEHPIVIDPGRHQPLEIAFVNTARRND
jgi:hypothetical protein